MRTILVTALVCMSAICADAQDSKSTDISFEELQVKAGELVGNFKSGQMVQHLKGGVKLVLIAKDPAENMKIDANTIDFFYDEKSPELEEGTPSRMELNGDIVITSQTFNIRSQKAIVRLDTMEATFIGSTEFSADGGSPGKADGIVVNFNTGDINMSNANIPKLDLMPKTKKE